MQLDLSRSAVEAVRHGRDGAEVRIGYFSGTLTHQSDFRMIAPVLVRLLREFPGLMLTVAGDFDLGTDSRNSLSSPTAWRNARLSTGDGFLRKLHAWTSTSFRS